MTPVEYKDLSGAWVNITNDITVFFEPGSRQISLVPIDPNLDFDDLVEYRVKPRRVNGVAASVLVCDMLSPITPAPAPVEPTFEYLINAN